MGETHISSMSSRSKTVLRIATPPAKTGRRSASRPGSSSWSKSPGGQHRLFELAEAFGGDRAVCPACLIEDARDGTNGPRGADRALPTGFAKLVLDGLKLEARGELGVFIRLRLILPSPKNCLVKPTHPMYMLCTDTGSNASPMMNSVLPPPMSTTIRRAGAPATPCDTPR